MAAYGDAEAASFIRNNAEAWTVIEAAARLSEGLETTDAVTHKLNLARGLAKTNNAANPLDPKKEDDLTKILNRSLKESGIDHQT